LVRSKTEITKEHARESSCGCKCGTVSCRRDDEDGEGNKLKDIHVGDHEAEHPEEEGPRSRVKRGEGACEIPLYSELAPGCYFNNLQIVSRSWPLGGKTLLEELLDSVRAA
jgi:hypothetical protein